MSADKNSTLLGAIGERSMRADGYLGATTALDFGGSFRASDLPAAVCPTSPQVAAGAQSRASVIGAVVALVGVMALALARWQVTGAVVPWDSKNHFYAMFRFLGDALRHGTVPLWNPYHFGGYPAVADPQSLLFTPTMALFALLMPHASMEVFDAVVYAHLCLGGCGVLGLGRRWNWPMPAALLAALVFMLGGSAASRLQHTGMIISYSFFPLALWALEAALDRCSLRLAAVAGGTAALMALGRDQVAFLLCLTLAGFGLRHALAAADAVAYLRRRLPVVALALVTTVAITAVPILLTMQFLHGSNRPGIAYGMALEGSLDPVNLLTLFAPDVYGSLDRAYDYWGPGAATAAGNDWTDRSIDYLFAGTLPLVLLAWHGLAGARAFGRGARFLALITALALLYAFGRHTSAFGLAFDWVPGVSLYRRPADATFIANVGVALLSGHLLARFMRDGLPRPSPAPTAIAATVAALVAGAVVVGSGLSFARPTGHLGASLAGLIAPTLSAICVIAILLACRSSAQRRVGTALLVAATAGQLVWFNAASPLNAEPAAVYSAYEGIRVDQTHGLAVLRSELAMRRARGEHPRVEMLGLDGSWQNASMVFGIENTTGYNPLRIAAYEEAVGVGESANDPNLRSFPDTFRGYNSRLARLIGLDYLVLDRPIADLPRQIPRPRSTLLFGGDHFYVYRLLQATTVPRAYLATRVRAVRSDAAIEGGAMPAFDVDREALIDARDLPLVSNATLIDEGAPPSTPATAAITSYGDNRITLDVQAPAGGGVVVLHDLTYAGWIALVDGRPEPVLRTNLLFRGVEVPAGHHVVEFAFHPLSVANLKAALFAVARSKPD